MFTPMERTAQQARENWADLLGTVTYTGQPATITRHGKPIAQVTPIGDPWVITVERLNDNSEWVPVQAPEIIYTDAIGIRVAGAAELAADDRGNPPGSQWRAQAWPGTDTDVTENRDPWEEETHNVPQEIDLTGYNIVEIAEQIEHGLYEEPDRGKYALQYEDECVAIYETPEAALTYFKDKTNRDIELVPAENYWSGLTWDLHYS